MQTGRQAIHSRLPLLRGSAPGNYATASNSGYSTSITPPPKTISAFPAQNTFQTLLDRLGGLRQVLNTLEIAPTATEESHNLITEGDVERASALYLLHDVNIVIERYFLTQLHLPGPTIECLAQSTGGRSRPDIKYVVNGVVVLIVEFKNINTLDDMDWTEFALATRVRTPQEVINRIPPNVQTALRGNATILSQQATKYSESCPIIVLCNYQNMIVLDFSPGGQRYDDRANPVHYFFSDEQAITHKALLLAAFLYGLEKRGRQLV